MSNFHTNLSVSQKIASLGVKAESEMYWVRHRQWKYTDEGMRETKPKWDLMRWGTIDESEWCPAFNLAELADVFKELGKIEKCGRSWSNTYSHLCSIFFEDGESAANKYLEEIL